MVTSNYLYSKKLVDKEYKKHKIFVWMLCDEYRNNRLSEVQILGYIKGALTTTEAGSIQPINDRIKNLTRDTEESINEEDNPKVTKMGDQVKHYYITKDVPTGIVSNSIKLQDINKTAKKVVSECRAEIDDRINSKTGSLEEDLLLTFLSNHDELSFNK